MRGMFALKSVGLIQVCILIKIPRTDQKTLKCELSSMTGENFTDTHCEYCAQKHSPNSTSWWILCNPKSHSSISHVGRSPPRTSCENAPSVWTQASDGKRRSDHERSGSGRKWKQARSHYQSFRPVCGDRSDKCLSLLHWGFQTLDPGLHQMQFVNSSCRVDTRWTASGPYVKMCWFCVSKGRVHVKTLKWWVLVSATEQTLMMRLSGSAVRKLLVTGLMTVIITRSKSNQTVMKHCFCQLFRPQ